jgi:hypothetical protein
MNMATPDFTPRSKTKLCVLRGALNNETGTIATGVFAWEGKSWRTATITRLVTELPANISDKDLRAAYTAAVKAVR